MYTSSGECSYCNITYYSTGPTYSQGTNFLYFAVYDPSGDTSVKFTITDPNATRDGLVNPVFSATVPINNTTFAYYSAQTGVSFTFPADLKIGGGWNVTASGTLGGNVSYPIFVGTYFEDIEGAPEPGSIVLPGETITTAYQAISDQNGALDSAITNVSYNGHYYGANDTWKNLFTPGIATQQPAAFGSYTWTVPADATWDSYLLVTVWVSIYVAGHMAENESYGVEYLVGGVYIDFFDYQASLGSVCPADGSQQYYTSGTLVQACALVGATANDQFSPVPNLSVAINFWNGTAVVTPPGNTPTSLVSNATGFVTFSFWADSPQFSSSFKYPFYNTVNLTVSDPSAKPVPANIYDKAWSNGTFYVTPGSGSVGVTVGLNQLSYYPGQTISGTWSINPTNLTTGAVTATGWIVYGFNSDFLSQGPISSTANTGTFTVVLPAGYTGRFTVDLFASNATESFEGQVSAVVLVPVLFLNPSSTTFTPGSSVTVTAQAWGDASVSAPTISYEVYAEYDLGYTGSGGGGLVSSGTVANGSSFTINVPSTGAPGSYTIYASLGSATSGTVATAMLRIAQSWGYTVFVGVTTQSSYSDGSYQPGQTVTVSYQISPYGNAPLPTFYTFAVYLYGTQISSLISTSSTSGTVQVTIPSGWQTGLAILEVELEGTWLTGNSCYGGYCYGETGITINAHPSALSMEIGAGSGLTVGWLILLIIVVVLFVVLLLLVRRKRASPPSGGMSVTTPMNPPAPAPSGPGAAAWEEPNSNPPPSGGQPPMPSPPPGAT